MKTNEIEAIWKQLSMKPLSSSLFRFASEIASAQQGLALKAVGKWLETRYNHEYERFARILPGEIDSFLRGEIPGGNFKQEDIDGIYHDAYMKIFRDEPEDIILNLQELQKKIEQIIQDCEDNPGEYYHPAVSKEIIKLCKEDCWP